ncbi:uncharacterized protein LOC124885715 [Capsicum annuum]|uniref:uncharacterized protein LOC124885715 n=1 Tax=Capsicum annuum TaxID=4072 RepID=UPI001FB0FAA9|nr:uncharacterized protein LOC124885715 [Capsicum annuum]
MASKNFSFPSPPIFSGENYLIWAIKMRTYLRVYDVGSGRGWRRGLSEVIFTRVMASDTAKEAWDKLKEEFQGSDKIRQIKVINLRREFEILRIKDSETIEEFSNKLMKVLVSFPERFEAKISSLEDSKDLTKLSLSELVHALQDQEQRRSLRLEEATETALQAKFKGKMQIQEEADSRNEVKNRENFPPCKYCRKTNHKEDDCRFKGKKPPLQCRYCNKLGHIERFCKVKKENNQQTQKPTFQKLKNRRSLYLWRWKKQD